MSLSTSTNNAKHNNANTAPELLDVEAAVRERYSGAAQVAEPALCCPVRYDAKYLEALPPELIERDYGCGDPSRHFARGQTVLDLGSGGGKICYIASQIVGRQGRVIGVDMNDDMLGLARQYQHQVGQRIGWHNVEFYKARIQDLALDLEAFEARLRERPVDSADKWFEAHRLADQMRRESPMIADQSIDVVASNCVLNLVDPKDRPQLFREIHRVLRRGGCAVISDIVSDEPLPPHLQNDARLWSGCISGAYLEQEFLAAFGEAGFYGMELLDFQQEPWATIEGIEMRSVTVRAYKGKEGPCVDHQQAVVYRGPWKSVTDDDGHVLKRGVRSAVCAKTFEIYTGEPYRDQVVPIPAHQEVNPALAPAFDCQAGTERHPRETKGQQYELTQLPESGGCGSSGNCC